LPVLAEYWSWKPLALVPSWLTATWSLLVPVSLTQADTE
jgi:hypothetical protein